jgi:hypothetical protein
MSSITMPTLAEELELLLATSEPLVATGLAERLRAEAEEDDDDDLFGDDDDASELDEEDLDGEDDELEDDELDSELDD